MHTLPYSELKTAINEVNDLGVLADNIGELKQLIAELEAKHDLFSDALKAKLADGERAIGTKWSALKTQPNVKPRLDAKKVEEALGKDILADFYVMPKSSPRLTVDATKIWEQAA